MARWRRWRQFSILTIFSDFLVMNWSEYTISLSKHICKKCETFTNHFRTLWFCVFFWKLPSKEQFRILCVKKEIAYHYSRMKSGKKYKFQFMKEVVKFLFPVWPASFKSILQSIEKMRGTEVFKLVIQCWKIFITISGRVIGVLDPNCIQNWCKKSRACSSSKRNWTVTKLVIKKV